MASSANKKTSSRKTSAKKSTSSSSSRKSSSTRKTNTSGYSRSRNQYEEAYPEADDNRPERVREIYLFAYLAFAILLLLSNFGLCGAAGNVVAGFLFGLFGAVEYAIPLFIFLAAAFLIANGPRRSILKKIIWIAVAIVIIGMICQLVYGVTDMSVPKLYSLGYHDKKAGGVICGGLAIVLNLLIGKAGLIIVIIFLSIITIIEVLDVSIIDLFKQIFNFNLGQSERPEKRRGQRYSNYEREDYDDYDDDDDYDEYDEVLNEYDDVPVNDSKRNILKSITVLGDNSGDKKADKKNPKAKKLAKAKLGKGDQNSPNYSKPTNAYGANNSADSDIMNSSNNSNISNNESFIESGLTELHADNTETNVDPKKGQNPYMPSFLSGSNQSDKQISNGKGANYGDSVMDDTLTGANNQSFGDTYNSDDSDIFAAVDKAKKNLGDENLGDDNSADNKKNRIMGADVNKESLIKMPPTKSVKRSVNSQGYTDLKPSKETYDDGLGDSTVGKSTSANDLGITDNEVSARETLMGLNKSSDDTKTEKVNKKDKEEATQSVANEIKGNEAAKPVKVYKFPPMSLLKSGKGLGRNNNDAAIRETAKKLKDTLESFGVNVTITDYACGPAVTRYEMQPEQGVKVSKILGLADDIKLNLAAADIRIEAPIPGKAAIGIEVPNKENQMVLFRDIIDNDTFKKFGSNIAFAVGKDISGQVVITDIAKMPHLLIAGSTGSGKSVCINTLIMSILYKAHPDDVKLIMVDPKMVELTVYNGIPHLLIPVVTDPKKAAGALNWAVMEMTKRYQLFANHNVRNLQGYNSKVEAGQILDPDGNPVKKMPQIVVIVDELADLMMVAHGEVEDSIVRLSQLARAAGIHLVIATQRPSVDVITGLIKANVPSRVAFAVSSGVDSRTILDMVGAEKLLGKGDMLFYPTGYPKPVRVQGAFINDDEVVAIVDYIKSQFGETKYDDSVTESIENSSAGGGNQAAGGGSSSDDNRFDELFEDAARLVIEKDKASIGHLQRVFRIGFNRAARIMDQLCEAGVVGPEEGTKPRRILMTIDQFEEFMNF